MPTSQLWLRFSKILWWVTYLCAEEPNHALRKIALYTSLEQRSSIRVQGGVVGATEQVSYLEKVAKAYESEIDAETDIMTARLALAALCAGDQYEAMNTYLATISKAP